MKNARRRKRLSEVPPLSVSEPEQNPSLPWKLHLAAACLSLIVSFFLYGNILHGDFVYDDLYFSERQDLRNTASLLKVWTQPYLPQNQISGGGFYRPLWVASLALNFILFGSGTLSFHIVNTLLYAGILYLLFIVSYRLFHDRLLASITVLLFAFFPIHTEAVANIKSRDELLSALFVLGSWYVFLRATEANGSVKGKAVWGSAILFLLSLFAKENVVFMPLLFFLVWMFYQKPSWREISLGALPFGLAYLCYIPLRMHALGRYAFFADKSYYVLNPLVNVPFLTRLSTGFEILYLYIAKTFIPYHLSASYDFAQLPIIAHPFASWMSVAGMVFLLILITLVFLPYVPKAVKTGSLFFLVSYAVISKIFYAKGAPFGERLIFLSSIGLSIIGGWIAVKIIRWNRIGGLVLFFICLVAYAAVILPRNLVWREPMGFFEQMVKDAPQSVQARSALARGYFNMGKLADSYTQAMAGYAIYKKHPPLLNVLGKLSYIQGDYTQAEAYFKEAVSLEPETYDSHHFYALTLMKLGKYVGGMDHIRQQLKKHPEDNNMRFIMAVGMYKMGFVQEAMSEKYIWTKELDRAGREKILREF